MEACPIAHGISAVCTEETAAASTGRPKRDAAQRAERRSSKQSVDGGSATATIYGAGVLAYSCTRVHTRLLAYSLTHLLAYSRTRVLAYSLTRLLAYSLTYSRTVDATTAVAVPGPLACMVTSSVPLPLAFAIGWHAPTAVLMTTVARLKLLRVLAVGGLAWSESCT